MALADACLVCLSIVRRTIPIAILDNDSQIHRRFRNDSLPLADLPWRVDEDDAPYTVD